MWDPYAEFETAVLPNGLTVHVAHWAGKPWVQMGFVVHSGARHDLPGREGTAHFVERMVSRNTVIPYQTIGDFFERFGGWADLGVTNKLCTKYSFFAPTQPDLLALALGIFGDMLLSGELSSFLKEQRQVIREEFALNYPKKWQYDLVLQEYRTVFGDHWLSRSASTLGTLDTIASIKKSDLQTFYDTHYVPENMSVVCVGGLGLDEMVHMLMKSPFAIRKSGRRQQPLSPLDTFPAPLENRRVFEESKETGAAPAARTAVFNCSAVFPATLEWHAVRILRSMLSQVLFQEIREKRGWTYSIFAHAGLYQDVYTFQIESDAVSLECVDQIEAVVEECIDLVRDNTELFQRKRHNELVSYEMIDPNADGIRNNAITELGVRHRIITNTEEHSKIESLTIDDIRSVLEWFRPERRFTLLKVP